ncbi:Uncharacterised protein [Vibrio cholerae]|nr:Uncharacterised protein [Vibrio cholerae]
MYCEFFTGASHFHTIRWQLFDKHYRMFWHFYRDDIPHLQLHQIPQRNIHFQ